MSAQVNWQVSRDSPSGLFLMMDINRAWSCSPTAFRMRVIEACARTMREAWRSGRPVDLYPLHMLSIRAEPDSVRAELPPLPPPDPCADGDPATLLEAIRHWINEWALFASRAERGQFVDQVLADLAPDLRSYHTRRAETGARRECRSGIRRNYEQEIQASSATTFGAFTGLWNDRQGRVRELPEAVAAALQDPSLTVQIRGPGYSIVRTRLGNIPVLIRHDRGLKPSGFPLFNRTTSPARRLWAAAQALFEAGFGTPQRIAFLERKEGSYIAESWIVSSSVGQSISGRHWLRSIDPVADAARQFAFLESVLQRLIRLYRSGLYAPSFSLSRLHVSEPSPAVFEWTYMPLDDVIPVRSLTRPLLQRNLDRLFASVRKRIRPEHLHSLARRIADECEGLLSSRDLDQVLRRTR